MISDTINPFVTVNDTLKQYYRAVNVYFYLKCDFWISKS